MPLNKTYERHEWLYEQLLAMDWVSRHRHLDRILLHSNRSGAVQLLETMSRRFSPDKLIYGTNTGVKVRPKTTIALKDRVRYRQRLLADMWRRRRWMPAE